MTDSSNAIPRLSAALSDRYRIEREIGQGGMATVYRAHDVRHDRTVAVKGLRQDLASELGADRFVREIRLAARLTHPHILPLFDSGEADGFLYFVMPLAEGESLRDRLRTAKQLAVDEALLISREVADALDYAHRHDVVHRDIKPENSATRRPRGGRRLRNRQGGGGRGRAGHPDPGWGDGGHAGLYESGVGGGRVDHRWTQ